jgi:hypothetical protein
MKFKSENSKTGTTFQCKVQCGRCVARNKNGTRCKRNVCTGRKVCHTHRKVDVGLEVKTSNIPNAGKGLFAAREFKKDSVIGVYAGEVLTLAQHSARHGANKHDHGPYSIQVGNRIVDAACRRGLMSLANGSKSMARANARFVDNIRPSGGINVKATKRIRSGQEIIVYYGADYFKSAKYHTHTTK